MDFGRLLVIVRHHCPLFSIGYMSAPLRNLFPLRFRCSLGYKKLQHGGPGDAPCSSSWSLQARRGHGTARHGCGYQDESQFTVSMVAQPNEIMETNETVETVFFLPSVLSWSVAKEKGQWVIGLQSTCKCNAANASSLMAKPLECGGWPPLY